MNASAIRQPVQARSQRTMTRILEATEQLLQDARFEGITIQEIVRAAGTSVGAFYARFANKAALLPALYDRYDATIPRTLEEAGIPTAENLEERVGQLVSMMVELFVSRRGILRAMTIHARVHPETIPLEARESRKRLHRAIRDQIFEFAAEIHHPDPPLAIDLGLFMVAATIREKLLFGEAPHANSLPSIEPEQLRVECSRALLSYLRGTPAT